MSVRKKILWFVAVALCVALTIIVAVTLTERLKRPRLTDRIGFHERMPMPDPVTDRDEFLKWQQQVRGRLWRMMGIPIERVLLKPEYRGHFETDGVIVEKWILTLEPGSKAPAVLYRPSQTSRLAPLPAVVLTFGHGESKSHPSCNYIGQALAKLNVICLVIDPIGEEERHKKLVMGSRAHDSEALQQVVWNAGRPIMGKLVFDTMRGVDFLLTRQDVDPERIGVVGNSLGGVKAGWMAVLDTRLRCAIVSGWAFSPLLSKKGKLCVLAPYEQMRRILDWHEYLSLAAPHCSVLVANGDADTILDRDGNGDVWRDTDAAVAKTREVYASLGDRTTITTWYEQGGGHRPYPAHPEVLAWLIQRLNPPGVTAEKVTELPRVNFGKWADANGVRFERLYGTELHFRGATVAGLDITYLPPEQLRVLNTEEVGAPEFTIEGWLKRVQDKAATN